MCVQDTGKQYQKTICTYRTLPSSDHSKAEVTLKQQQEDPYLLPFFYVSGSQ